MKVILGLIIFSSLFLFCSPKSFAQNATTAAQRVERLHAQFLEAQQRETSLRERLEELNEALKPENIDQSIGRMGSTRPEELRAKRRRQLENEKAIVEAQLKELDTSRERLVAEIRYAESAAYQESAQITSSSQASDSIGMRTGGVPRWMVRGVAVGISMIAILLLISLLRRRW